jgi:hypothetical protein
MNPISELVNSFVSGLPKALVKSKAKTEKEYEKCINEYLASLSACGGDSKSDSGKKKSASKSGKDAVVIVLNVNKTNHTIKGVDEDVQSSLEGITTLKEMKAVRGVGPCLHFPQADLKKVKGQLESSGYKVTTCKVDDLASKVKEDDGKGKGKGGKGKGGKGKSKSASKKDSSSSKSSEETPESESDSSSDEKSKKGKVTKSSKSKKSASKSEASEKKSEKSKSKKAKPSKSASASDDTKSASGSKASSSSEDAPLDLVVNKQGNHWHSETKAVFISVDDEPYCVGIQGDDGEGLESVAPLSEKKIKEIEKKLGAKIRPLTKKAAAPLKESDKKVWQGLEDAGLFYE